MEKNRKNSGDRAEECQKDPQSGTSRRKLTNGTRRMVRKTSFPLPTDELCSIITACGGAGVSELKFGDLNITFGLPPRQIRFLREANRPPASKTGTAISEIQEQEAEKALEEDELALRDEQIENLFIEDPVRAEELLERGELTDADRHDGQEA